MAEFLYSHRVRYREADPMGFVYHVHCLDWFEAARTEALRTSGLSYRELEEGGIFMPVVDLAVRYHRPVFYDDVVVIEVSWSDEPPDSRMRFDYAVRRKDEPAVLISGHVTLCFISRDGRRPLRAPESLRNAVSRISKGDRPT